MCAKVIWLTLKSKHWKQNLAANHQAVKSSKTCYPNDFNSLWVICKVKTHLARCTF